MNITSSTMIRPSDPSGYAVCTLVMKNFNYAVGAAVLAHSIRQHNVAASLVCLVTTDLVDPACIPAHIRKCTNLYLADNYPHTSRNSASCPPSSLTALKLLLNVFHHVVLVSPITFPVPLRRNSRFAKDYQDWLPQCFSKFYIFRLTVFSKVLFLDADMLCLGDFSDVFTFDTPFGTLTDNDLLFEHGECVSQAALLRSLKTRYGISAACFCITPSLLEYDRVIGRLRQRCGDTVDSEYFETAESIRDSGTGSTSAWRWSGLSIPITAFGGSKPELNAGPDEQLLGWMYFHHGDDIAGLTGWTTISCLYNCQSFRIVRDVPSHLRDQVRLIHYVTDKPWDKCGRNGKIWPDMERWFDQLELLMMGVAVARVRLGGVTPRHMRVLGIGLDDDDKQVLSSLREGNVFMTQEEADNTWMSNTRPAFSSPPRKRYTMKQGLSSWWS